MSIKLSEAQSDIVNDIAVKEGFKNYKIFATSGSNKGDGFLGVIACVVIKDDNKKLCLILKSAHINEVVRQKAPIVDVYRREIFLYEEVFPAFRKFQKEYNVSDGFSAYAKVYGSSMKEFNECIILGDLREINYKMWNKKVPMNSEHLTSVIKEYGKLHATSLAMKIREPDLYEQLTQRLENMFTPEADKFMWQHSARHIPQSALKAVEGNQSAMEVVKKLIADVENFYYKAFNVVEDRLVILHGDCWNNNMIFNYGELENKDTSKPKKVCLLDWQLSRPGSPVVDLSYFFIVCASKADLANYKTYLRIYHDTVAAELSKFSCDVEEILPFSLLETHWKKYCKFGIFMAIILIRIMLSEEEEVPDLERLTVKDLENFRKKSFSEFSHADEYNQRILDIVTVISEYGLV